MADPIGIGGIVASLGYLLAGGIDPARGGVDDRGTQAPRVVAVAGGPGAQQAPAEAIREQRPRFDWGQLRLRESLEVPGQAWSVAFSPDGSLLASGTLPSEGPGPAWVVVWETATWKPKASIKIDRMRIQHVAFAPNGREVVASGLDESRLVVCDLESGKVRDLVREEKSGGLQTRPAFSPDGRFMIVATEQEGVTIWQVDGWSMVQYVYGFRDHRPDLVVDPSLPWVAHQCQGRIFAIDGFGLARKISPVGMMPLGMVIPPGEIYTGPPWFRGHRIRGVEPSWCAKHLALAPDAGSAAFASMREDRSSSLDVYDVRDPDHWSRKARIDLGDRWDSLYSLAFTPDGRTLVACCADRRIRAWDVESAKELPSLEGLDSAVMGIVFSPDGSRMASAWSQARTIRVYSTGGERPR